MEKDYNCPDGWYVESNLRSWLVVLIKSGKIVRSKKIGRIGAKKTNYFDNAVQLVDQRNKNDGYIIPPHMAHIAVKTK